MLRFAGADHGNYFVEYESVEILENYVQRQPTFRHGIYSFFHNCPLSDARTGKDMIVCDIKEDLKRLLTNLIPESIYNQTFSHPTKFENGKNDYRKDWIPLIKNPNDDIVSICNYSENSIGYKKLF